MAVVPTTTEAAAVTVRQGVATVTFGGSHANNTFPTWKMVELAGTFRSLNARDDVRAVVMTAGGGRSFGVGGDFNEVHTFTGGDEVRAWIEACVDMYQSVLELDRPVVAAIEGYAIGIGLQLALCADYRVCGETSDLRMPEFDLGIACVLGACLLEGVVGRATTTRMVFGCSSWKSGEALRDGLVAEVRPAGTATRAAVELAERFAGYAPLAVTGTKRYLNQNLRRSLDEAKVTATTAHQAGFAQNTRAQQKMLNVLGRDSA